MNRIHFLLNTLLSLLLLSCSSSTQDEPTQTYPATPIVKDIESHNEKVFKDFFNDMTKGATSDNESDNVILLLQNIAKYIDEHRGKRLPLMESLIYTNKDVTSNPNTSVMSFTAKPEMVYGGVKISFQFNVGVYDESYIAKINHCDGFYLRGTIKHLAYAGGTLPYALYNIDCNNTEIAVIPMGEPDVR